MIVKVTDEMIAAYDIAWSAVRAGPAASPGSGRRAGIRAVLEIVERDYVVRPKGMGEK